MYRVLKAHGETAERRNQRQARSHAVPRLEATRPNQVWTWDISKLATYTAGVFLNLYLVLDLFSPTGTLIARFARPEANCDANELAAPCGEGAYRITFRAEL